MPHLPGSGGTAGLKWNYANRLEQTYASSSAVARYSYDGGGNRVVKRYGSLSGYTLTPSKVTVYLPGGFEITRTLGSAVQTEWQTLAVMDDRTCVARIEAQTIEAGVTLNSTAVLRYQLGNHLGSSCLETTDSGQVLTREEYYPYGGTAYAFAASGYSGFSVKRYRYAGKECDSENGLYYFGARYFAAWLGRWTAGDPVFHAGRSSYEFCSGNPVSRVDPDGAVDVRLPAIAVSHDWAPLAAVQAANRMSARAAASQDSSMLERASGAVALALGVGAEALLQGANETRIRTAESGQLAAKAALEAKHGDVSQATSDASVAAGGILIGFVEGLVAAAGRSSPSPTIGRVEKEVTRRIAVLAIRVSKAPQGLSSQRFAEFSTLVRRGVGQIGDDIAVHGSRASGTAGASSDIDIAVRLSSDKFDAFLKSRFGTPNSGSALERTMQHASATGKIQAGEAGLRGLRRSLAKEFSMRVDISVIRIGGPFDQGPYIPLR